MAEAPKDAEHNNEEKPRGNNEILGVHFGHQEVERVVQGIDDLFEFLPPDQWLSDQQASNLLCKDLGYEDVPEFEDALRGTFEQFLEHMPHLETRPMEGIEEGGVRFRIKALPPPEERVSKKWVYKINTRADLWRVCLKQPTARLYIPELEFEISADGKRHVDAIYNHIAAAIWNLGAHVREDLKDKEESEKFKIMSTAAALNVLLDVEDGPGPWTIVMWDPDGVSCFKPDGEAEGKVVLIEEPDDDDDAGNENEGKFVTSQLLNMNENEAAELAALNAEGEKKVAEQQ